ncbi:protein YIF1B-A-like [Oppia nitens]|uniref:protein YIF1B-A-like n=1 Tax=Oppia nitens TaxID=1686743 RepID=UPI0023DB0FAC|nr:protein YIF1B-A-like [Oppia nitens]
MDYTSGTTRRSRPNNANESHNTNVNYPYGSYDAYETNSQPYSANMYSGGPSVYDPNGPQLFEDTSAQFDAHNTYDPYMNSGNNFVPQMFNQNMGNASNLFNQQLILTAGQQLLTNPMAAAAIDQYGQNLVNKGKSWVGSNLKYYFAVDTSYVLKKLGLVFFPFTHKDWSIRYNTNESVAPRDDINSPDLYIPMMAFVTYILFSAYLLGIQNRFSPEVLSIQASSALAWLFIEVIIVMVSLYLFSISCSLGFFHTIAFGGYKYVCIVPLLLMSTFDRMGYYILLLYCSLSLGFFLLKSLHIAVQNNTQTSVTNQSRNGLYLVIVICLLQPIVMYFLTRHFIV